MYLFTSRVENSVNPDHLALKKPADQDLHYFQTGLIPVSRVRV